MLPGTHSAVENFIGPEPTNSVICLNGSVAAIRSGMMIAMGGFAFPNANSILGNGLVMWMRNVRSSGPFPIPTNWAAMIWPMESRTIHRFQAGNDVLRKHLLAVMERSALGAA